MPRYFFDVRDGIEVIDNTGQDLPDLEAAKSEAVRIASGYAADPKMVAGDGGAVIVVIRDGPDSEVCTIHLAFTID